MSVKVKAKPWGAAGWETCTEKQNANCIFRRKQQNVWKAGGYEELFCVLTTGLSSVNVWWMFVLSQKKGLRCQKKTSPMGRSELCTFKKHVLEPMSKKNYFVALCLHQHEPKTTSLSLEQITVLSVFCSGVHPEVGINAEDWKLPTKYLSSTFLYLF